MLLHEKDAKIFFTQNEPKISHEQDGAIFIQNEPKIFGQNEPRFQNEPKICHEQNGAIFS